MSVAAKSSSWMLTTRRKMLGALLLGAGTMLSGFKMNALGERARHKGKVLLDRLPKIPPGLEEAVRMPFIEVLHGRRSRRFPLGAEIKDGPFQFKSQHEPLPLSELEQMLVLTATAGNTGWHHLIPHNSNYLPHIPNYAGAAGGRTFPSGGGIHTTEFFYTDDNGVYFLPTRDAPSLLERDGDGAMDLNAYLQAHRSRLRKLSDKRLHIPAHPAHIEMHNPWCANRPGSTLIIPVVDLAQHHLLNFCYLVQNGACIYDDINQRAIPGMARFKNIVDVEHPYPLSFLEQITLQEASVEVGTACYAGMLMLQAIGLGGWTYAGINPFSVLGASGDPEVPGLGFRFDTDERWPLPNVTGLAGVFEGLCPPHFSDMRAAVESVVQRKFGPGGPFHRETPGPYRDNAKMRSSAKVHDEEFKDCVTTMAQYTYDQFGRCPGTASSIFVMMYLQAHHLDLEFYDKYYTPNSYLETHARHHEWWHGA
ncbi:MAG: hypothetical protein DKINENOH_03555 [bacterium]|nr:hypothetical protein [bacterium]